MPAAIPLLLLGVESEAEAMHDHRALHGRSRNGYWVVSGNVWPELITVGTAMRPMVSGMMG